jgi:hypothetical protein
MISWSESPFPAPAGVALLATLTGVLAGCGERDRLTFPTPPDGIGPVTVIEEPSVDTVASNGDALTIVGRSEDVDGVDSVYFRLFGTAEQYEPLNVDGNTVRWSLRVTAPQDRGETIVIRASAVDRAGNRGVSVERTIQVPAPPTP